MAPTFSGMSEWSLTLHSAIAEIASDIWDLCAGDENPFVSHAFLSALEESGSVGRRTGWLARHASLRNPDGDIVAVAPLYLKGHSYGEYVFDHAWAQAFEQAGGRYYPKMQLAVPFSPVSGPRLLLRPMPAPQRDAVRVAFGSALMQACGELGLSSIHTTFCREAEQAALAEAGWLPRYGLQYHWQNDGYADFEAFLERFASRKRKAVRKERREAQGAGLVLHTKIGREIEARDWAAFYRFYCATVDRKWGSAYLTEAFFPMLSDRLGDRVVLMTAEADGEPVAAALNLRGRDTLYGRNWGCEGEWPYLHFELCYYRAIEFAIAHGLKRVEAGAQGEHKIQRGYLPVLTRSAHYIAHPGLRDAVADFLAAERPAVESEIKALAAFSPYRQANQ